MAADLVTFVLLSNEAGGISNEMNPVMVAAYGALGLLGAAFLEVGLAILLVVLLSGVHRPWMLVLAASIAMLFGGHGAFGNVTAWLGQGRRGGRARRRRGIDRAAAQQPPQMAGTSMLSRRLVAGESPMSGR